MCFYTHRGGELVELCIWAAKGRLEECDGPEYLDNRGGSGFPSDQERARGRRCPCGRWPARECAGECGVLS